MLFYVSVIFRLQLVAELAVFHPWVRIIRYHTL